MSGQMLRERYVRRFAGFEKYDTIQSWFVFGSFVAQIIICIGMGHILLALPVTALTISLMIFSAVFVATRLRGLNNIVHECSHVTFARDRESNVMFGSLSAALILSCYKDYRDEHLTHHAHLGDYEKDLDIQGIKDLRLHEPLTLPTILRHVLSPFVGRHLPYYLGMNLSARDGRGYMMLKFGLLAATLLLLIVAPLTALLFVLVPYLLIYSTLNYWTDCLDHAGLIESSDELDSSRNVLASGLVRFLFFPRYDCYHLVHHLFPHVPARHLEECHNILTEEPVYRVKKNATFAETRGSESAA